MDEEAIIAQFVMQIQNDLHDDNIGGAVSISIIKGNEILVSGAFGTQDNLTKAPADTNTIFRIGSITKSFTGYLLMIHYQEGILNLDDPVELYLPEIKNLKGYPDSSKITFRHLASHTSGLTRESGYREANFGQLAEWEEKVIKSIPETSFRSAPGERFGYSNIGYAILGLAISRAAKKPYMELVNEKILQPLKMKNTYFMIPEEKTNALAQGMGGGPLAELDFDLPHREHEGRGYRVPNGSIYSTSADLSKFMMANLGYSDLLTNDNLQLMHKTQTPTDRHRSNYGVGFELYSDLELATIGHAGSTPGYSAYFLFEKNTQYGVVIMRNYNWGNTNFDLRANALLRALGRLSNK